jgi:glycosyltransferase involved in cell wall biosynthesis
MTTAHEWPSIAVLIPTFDRAKIVVECVAALQTNLSYRGSINYYVGVDGEDDTTAQLNSSFGPSVTVLSGPRAGLGGNLNQLIANATEPLMMQMDDDHILRAPLELCPHVNELMENDDAGWIRLMGIEDHSYTANLRGRYWYLSWTSEELYIPSNRPHLKHRRWLDFFPPYVEGVSLYQTEVKYCAQCKDKAKQLHYKVPQVLVPLNSLSETGWDHVGESWQAKGY